MSAKSWIGWTVFALVGAVICAVAYYRGGGQTTWLFVAAIAFIIVWIPVQMWMKAKTRDAAERISDRR